MELQVNGTVISPYGESGASARVRVFEWLRRLGIEEQVVAYRSAGSNSFPELVVGARGSWQAERRLRDLDVGHGWLLLHREASPLSRGGIERRLLSEAAFSSYDLDDALFADRGGLRSLLGKERKAQQSATAASRVIVGNEFLAEWATALNSDVRIIPSCVDPSTYRQKSSYELGDPPTVVWVGSPSTEQHLLEWSDGIAAALRRHGAQLLVVSAGNRRLGALDPMTRRLSWSPETERQALAQADAGIMPLPDTDYSRGKCGYKLLLYGCAALPMVGSPVGVNDEILRRAAGLGPTTHVEWEEALSLLLGSSADDRRSRGSAAFEAVSKHYSYDRWSHEWRDAVGMDQ